MSLENGSRVASYEILQPLGAGGMGEVYRARDTKLGRDVAIKVLPESFALDAERLARFQREAQVLASLNHPNIAQIYGFEDSRNSGVQCIVMELVEGEALDQRLRRGPIPVDETIRIAHEIALALEAAHERGIVHRDLKPGNVMVTPDGKVKVLDFGLAKAFEQTTNPNVSNSPTLSFAATQAGIVLGTAAYMSPEQARGRSVDKRSDVWAFGCVIFEMLTGKRIFDGTDASEILAGVIKSDPEWTQLPESLPPMLRVFLRRCLEKDPKRRVHDIGDVRLALEGAFDVPAVASSTTLPAAQHPSSVRTLAFVALAILVAAAVGGFVVWRMRPSTAQPVTRLSASAPSSVRIGTPATDGDLVISPDGSHMVFQSGQSVDTVQLFVRALDRLEPEPVRGLVAPRGPFISPDGNWIGYFEGATMKKVAMNGGPSVAICNFVGAPRGATWGPNDIIFATSDAATGLLRVPAGGGDPQVLTKPGPEADHTMPEFLPGGEAVLFTILPRAGIALDTAQIAVLNLKTGKQDILIRGGTNPRYAASGHIVYAAGGTLRAVPFDLNRLEVKGNPIPVVENVLTKNQGAADFAISKNGTLSYITGVAQGSAERTLVWIDRQGHEEAIPVPTRAYVYPRIAPDGSRAALDIRDQENDIWIWDFSRRTLTRLTFDPGLNRGIAWSPDGKRLAFSAQREGGENVYWQAADGTGAAERLTKDQNEQLPNAFTPDGKRILYSQPGSAPFDIGIVDVEGDHKVEMLFHSMYSELNAEVSPDGRWLAYESNESRTTEVYVRPFPDINAGRWQISTGGGTRPLWSRNGRELFYISGSKMMKVDIQTGAAFSAGTPEMLFQGGFISPQTGRNYDVTADGKRFLMIKDARPVDSSAPPSQLVVVLNWFEELKRLVPVH
jgi:serine/threonine-protein kinase